MHTIQVAVSVCEAHIDVYHNLMFLQGVGLPCFPHAKYKAKEMFNSIVHPITQIGNVYLYY